jgi:proteasome alpha subunit
MVTPYDFNEAVQQRSEFAEERLRAGSPVVGIRYCDGLLLLSARRTQRKVFEIYDRLMMSAMGNQADVEAIRIAALDFSHQEGFARSPDDVTVNRIVGFALSPGLKKAFGDSWNAPLAFRGVLAELGVTPPFDRFATLNYDGDFAFFEDFAVAGGSSAAEDAMLDRLRAAGPGLDLASAVTIATEAWAIGHMRALQPETPAEGEEGSGAVDIAAYLEEQLQTMTLEAGILDRSTPLETKFRLLEPEELKRRS